MITQDFYTVGYCVFKNEPVAELIKDVLPALEWRPYRDIQLAKETPTSVPILEAMAYEISTTLGRPTDISRKEIWRGSIGGADVYHSDMEDEDNDCVAVVVVEAGDYPISFKDGDAETHLHLGYGDVLLINHHHPTALHKGPTTNGPTDNFIIGQVVMTWQDRGPDNQAH